MLLALALVVAVGAATAAAAHAGRPAGKRSGAPARVYWGAWIGSHLTGAEAPWSVAAMKRFEKLVGKGMSIVNFSSSFATCYPPKNKPNLKVGRCIPEEFPAGALDLVRAYGAIPMFSWASVAKPLLETRSRYQLADVARGDFDRYLTRWATAARKWRHPFFLRFNWEMNGRWFPWSEGVNGGRPGDFVRAWRHVHDIFTKVGASNVNWVWCPNTDYAGAMTPIQAVYPGGRYVDWTCLDGYNRNNPWIGFDRLFQETYDLLVHRIAPNKPLMVGETGATEQGGSKASWIEGMFDALRTRYTRVRAIVWFEKYDSGIDWPIESSRSARAAFARGIADRRYAANRFGSLAGAKIKPLP